ncbi:MAG: M13 family metallopeptidase [Bergeyella sp.]|nr:M13 family metallopeptidase [Bergeyella sp.]
MKKFTLMGGICLSAITVAQSNPQTIHLDYMDTSVRPQDDFYNYVNGNWMKTAKIPSDKSRWGSFSELAEKTDKTTLALMKNLLKKKYPKGSDEQKVTDLYRSYIDLDTRNKIGLKPVKKYIDRVNSLKSIRELEEYLIEVTPIGLNPFYGLYVGPDMKNSEVNSAYLVGGKLGLGRTYYQEDAEKNRQTLDDYVNYINTIYPYSGSASKDLKGSSILLFEKKMAKNLKTVVEARDPEKQYNPHKVEDLKSVVKNVDLEYFMRKIGANTDKIIISEVSYFKNLDKLLTQENLPRIKEYLIFNILNKYGDVSSEELEKLNFEFYGKKLSGQKEQRSLDKRGLRYVNKNIGELLGKIYVKDNFPPEAKENAKVLISYLFKSFDKHIRDLKWMSPATKEKALEKLGKFTVKIGYPDKWYDYSALDIGENSLIENALSINRWEFNDNLKDLGKPVDKSRWHMPPQMVNAYFNPQANEIVFPAAILQPPFYNYKADPAVNFGGIGTVIGHEISHGFDDSGAKYDGEGNLVNWWTKEDKKKFQAAVEALAKQYDKYEPVKGIFVNGKFTLGENIGDLGGVAIAYDALMLYLKDKGNLTPIDGFTQPQRFFLSYATIWRTKITDEAATNLTKTDPHSPGYFRSFGPLVNIDAFYKAFNVKKGDKLFKPKEERIVIW